RHVVGDVAGRGNLLRRLLGRQGRHLLRRQPEQFPGAIDFHAGGGPVLLSKGIGAAVGGLGRIRNPRLGKPRQPLGVGGELIGCRGPRGNVVLAFLGWVLALAVLARHLPVRTGLLAHRFGGIGLVRSGRILIRIRGVRFVRSRRLRLHLPRFAGASALAGRRL